MTCKLWLKVEFCLSFTLIQPEDESRSSKLPLEGKVKMRAARFGSFSKFCSLEARPRQQYNNLHGIAVKSYT